MTQPAAKPRRDRARYASKEQIKALVAATKAAEIKIGGVEFSRDGTVRILSEMPAATRPSAYDDWKRAEGASS